VLVAPRAGDTGTLEAWVLDVDVAAVPRGPVDEATTHAVGSANLLRLERSLDKWRRTKGLVVHPIEVEHLRVYARRGPDARVEIVWRPGHNVGPT
jgi:hypothetical protein